MAKPQRRKQSLSILELFVDPLFGAFGAFLFIFLMVVLMIGITGRQPVINTEILPEAFNGVDYQVWLSAQGGVGDYDWTLSPASSLPAGLQLTRDGQLLGTPQTVDFSKVEEEHTFEITLTAARMKVSDAEEASTRRRYLLRVNRDLPIELANLPPVKINSTSPLPDGIANQPYNLTLSALGGLPPYNWSCEQTLPSGLELDGLAGILKGVPRESTERAALLKFTVQDTRKNAGPDGRDSLALKLTILPPPPPPPPPKPPLVLITQKLPPAVEGKDYEAGIVVKGGTEPYKWSSVTKLPDWLKFDDTAGILRGTPPLGASVGKIPVGILVNDKKNFLKLNAEIEVLPQKGARVEPLSIISKNLPRAIREVDYDVPLTVRGGVAPLQFSAKSLPAGLSISPDGSIKGVPIQTGSYEIELNVKDSHAPQQSVTAQLSLVVDDPLAAIKILTPADLPNAFQGEAYNLAFAASGGDGSYIWNTPDTLPAGLELKDGRLQGVSLSEEGAIQRFKITAQSAGVPALTAEQSVVLKTLKGAKTTQKIAPPWWKYAILIGLLFTYGMFTSWMLKYSNSCTQAVVKKHGGKIVIDPATNQVSVMWPPLVSEATAGLELKAAIAQANAIGCMGKIFFASCVAAAAWYLWSIQ